MQCFRAFSKLIRSKTGSVLLVGALAFIGISVTSAPSGAVTRVEKTFGAWLVTCVDNGKEKNCSLETRAVTQAKKVAFVWNIAVVEKQLKSRLLVPANVSVPEGVRFSIGGANPQTQSYSVCGPRVCIADMPLDTALLNKIRAAKSATANFVTGAKKLVQIEVNLTDFPKAYDYFYSQLPK